MIIARLVLGACAATAIGGCSSTEEPAVPEPIVRHSSGSFPIASAVEVPPGHLMVFHSGVVPSPANTTATEGSREYWGDTKAQYSREIGRASCRERVL